MGKDEVGAWALGTQQKYGKATLAGQRARLGILLYFTIGVEAWGLIWHFRDQYAQSALVVSLIALALAAYATYLAWRIKQRAELEDVLVR